MNNTNNTAVLTLILESHIASIIDEDERRHEVASLEDAAMIAESYGADGRVYDAAGFVRGHAKSDGTWSSSVAEMIDDAKPSSTVDPFEMFGL